MFFDHFPFGLNFPECGMSKSGALVELPADLKFEENISGKRSGRIIQAVPSDVSDNEAMKC
jgi:hypothetical protein